MTAGWVGKYLILNDTLVTWRVSVNYFLKSISPESTRRPGKWLSRMCHSTHFISRPKFIPPPSKKNKTSPSMFVKKIKYLYLAILTTHFENQRVSGSASSDHLFINSLFKKKSITKHCNFFWGRIAEMTMFKLMAFEIVRLSHAESQTQWVHQSVTHPISFCPYKVGNFLSLGLRDRILKIQGLTNELLIHFFFTLFSFKRWMLCFLCPNLEYKLL